MMTFGVWTWSYAKGGKRYAFPPYGPYLKVCPAGEAALAMIFFGWAPSRNSSSQRSDFEDLSLSME